jgi:hypothetical protein
VTVSGAGGSAWAAAHVHGDFVRKNAVDIRGFVDDVCPSGREGAILYFQVRYERTGQVTRREVVNNKGCDKGFVSFDPAPYLSRGRTAVKDVHFDLCSYKYALGRRCAGGPRAWPRPSRTGASEARRGRRSRNGADGVAPCKPSSGFEPLSSITNEVLNGRVATRPQDVFDIATRVDSASYVDRGGLDKRLGYHLATERHVAIHER